MLRGGAGGRQLVLNIVNNAAESVRVVSKSRAIQIRACARGRVGAPVSAGQRLWHLAAGAPARVRAALHHEARRHVHGPVDQPVDRRGPRWAPARVQFTGRGRRVRGHAASMEAVMSDMPYVFVVDDDPSVRSGLWRLLVSDGCAVATFASAREFLDDPRIGQPGCIVIDLRMPDTTACSCRPSSSGVAFSSRCSLFRPRAVALRSRDKLPIGPPARPGRRTSLRAEALSLRSP